MRLKMKREALLIVDYQYDFVDPKGSLYIPRAETLKPYLENLIQNFHNKHQLVVASMDFHPNNHLSFKIWPPHCVQGSFGSNLYLDNDAISMIDKVIIKGVDQNCESYSAFFDDFKKSNGLDEYLKLNQITDLTIVGVALNICVKHTYDDAIKLGYKAQIDLNGSIGLEG
ncbi:isochorismatase family protein [Williamsoniiplasma luminosum]